MSIPPGRVKTISAFQLAALLPVGAALAWSVAAIATRLMSSERPETTFAWSAVMGLAALTAELPSDTGSDASRPAPVRPSGAGPAEADVDLERATRLERRRIEPGDLIELVPDRKGKRPA